MKITANIATYPPRQESLKKMLPSILEQFDEVRICLNNYESIPQFLNHPKIKPLIPVKNLTDNGKFAFVGIAEVDEIYCTLDDDLIYPKDYVEVIKASMEKYPDHVITFHGRELTGIYKTYYKAPHLAYACLSVVNKDKLIDVCGTGVTAFVPFNGVIQVATSSYQMMSDIVFSLHCAFEKKPIMVIAHKGSWIKHIHNKETISRNQREGDFAQAVLCAKIFNLKTK